MLRGWICVCLLTRGDVIQIPRANKPNKVGKIFPTSLKGPLGPQQNGRIPVLRPPVRTSAPLAPAIPPQPSDNTEDVTSGLPQALFPAKTLSPGMDLPSRDAATNGILETIRKYLRVG